MSVIDTLNIDFYITHSVSTTSNKSQKLTIMSDWKAKTDGVDKVKIYITGLNPKTGKELSVNEYSYYFDEIHTLYDAGVVNLQGEYFIHFDAELSNGETVENFKNPQKIYIDNVRAQPYIYYSYIKASIGWTGIRIKTNCYRRCSGSLWISYNGHFHRLPEFHTDTMVFYIPAAQDNIDGFININESFLIPVKNTER